jgi:outer membrane protein assembly factor BamB
MAGPRFQYRTEIPAIFVCILVLSPLTREAEAYTWRQAGVESDFLISEGRACFAQADGSLTVLDVDSGHVLIRTPAEDVSWYELRMHRDRIVAIGYRKVRVWDKETLEALWESDKHCSVSLYGNHLVSYDGNGLVEAREFDSGKSLWTYDLPGALSIVVENDKVLIHRLYGGDSTIALLDLDTGNEKFSKAPREGFHNVKSYFDGRRIYVLSGMAPSARHGTPPDFLWIRNPDGSLVKEETEIMHTPPEQLHVWDVTGNGISSASAPPEVPDGLALRYKPFQLDGRLFCPDGSIRSVSEYDPEFWRNLSYYVHGDEAEAVYRLNEGSLHVMELGDYPLPYSTIVEYVSGEMKWKAARPSLGFEDRIVAATDVPGKILLGSNYGVVDCLNKETGTPDWVYVFPTVRQTLSSSSAEPVPNLISLAIKHHAASRKRERTIPYRLLPGEVPFRPEAVAEFLATSPVPDCTIITDPRPVNPYDSTICRFVLWITVLAPLYGAVFLFHRKKDRRGITKSLSLLSLTLAAWTTLVLALFGWVSSLTTVALKAISVILLASTAGLVFYSRKGHSRFRAVVKISVLAFLVFLQFWLWKFY